MSAKTITKTSKEIRQFILKNHKTMSNKKMARELKIKLMSVAGYIAGMKRSGKLKNNNKKEKVSQERIKKFILNNRALMDNKQIAEELGIGIMRVAGFVAGMNRGKGKAVSKKCNVSPKGSKKSSVSPRKATLSAVEESLRNAFQGFQNEYKFEILYKKAEGLGISIKKK